MENEQGHVRRSDRLLEIIEERIATGCYPPGMRLDETELAHEFEVSRTPIREALMQLSFSGLVDMRPRRGAVVAEVTTQRLLEMYEVAAELEGMCGRLAARRISEAQLAQLLSAHRACDEAREQGDPDEYFRRNEEFHKIIYAASHNSFLIEQTVAMYRRLSVYRRLQLRVRDRLRSSFSEHAFIVAAIQGADGELAAELMRKHIAVQGERFADLLASLPKIGTVA
ncbi:GntR family transcriptional regulator [Geomonas sp.]|uniref:GntR family transcriptional regulator n=1 Tax=Geomonas sp. TaxID=2651584 RepID=UPI002B4A0FFC|nr:GntR family transcriptional regulator [Geomonas sp.]HJV33778.1 GntR family transcriptional regulator [Geomonas sp.]